MNSRRIMTAVGGVAVLAASVGLVRGEKRISEALVELATAVRLAPEVGRYGIVRALALDAAGKRDQADAELTAVVERHPFDREALSLLVRYRVDCHDTAGALTYARRLAALQPTDADLQRLVHRLAPRGNH